MAQPTKREKRSHVFTILFTPTERARLEEQAVARGTTIAPLIRAAILSQPLPDRKTGIEAEAIAALNRAGANLNQIARAANSTGGSLTAQQISALAALHKHIGQLAERIAAGLK